MRKYITPVEMEVNYLFGDHLGSTSLVTDASGERVAEMHYKPFGELADQWVDTTLTTDPSYELPKYSFTGQYTYLDDPTTSGVTEGFGLLFFRARFVDPALGRFISADTVIPPGAQGLDRYAFVNNNPLRFTDPTGYATEDSMCDGSSNQPDDCYSMPLPAPQPPPPTQLVDPPETNAGLSQVLGGWQGQANTAVTIDLPPSPFACEPVDCALSLVGVISTVISAVALEASAVPGAAPASGPIALVAFLVDLGVTVPAMSHTENDYWDGEISNTRRWTLHVTAFIGLFPHPIGAASSFINLLATGSGSPP